MSGYRNAQAGPSSAGTWFLHASATTAGVIMGGIVLLLIVRGYLYWSVRDTVETMKAKQTAAQTR